MKPILKNPQERICVALDFGDLDLAKKLVKKLANKVGYFKIGSELFTRAGPDSVKLIKELGGKVFLDLKFHDIPTTVSHAVAIATKLGVSLLNLHAIGGFEMMKKAEETVSEISNQESLIKPYLIAVTVLTSINSHILNQELKIAGSIEDYVAYLTKLALSAGLDGVVASPRETITIRKSFGQEVLVVTPGIRPFGVSAHDQKRIMTPRDAIKAGADILVIGRAITESPNPVEAVEKIINEIV